MNVDCFSKWSVHAGNDLLKSSRFRHVLRFSPSQRNLEIFTVNAQSSTISSTSKKFRAAVHVRRYFVQIMILWLGNQDSNISPCHENYFKETSRSWPACFQEYEVVFKLGILTHRISFPGLRCIYLFPFTIERLKYTEFRNFCKLEETKWI